MSEPRVAIVTGGLTGIGAACVTRLEEAGCRVVAGSRRSGLDVADTASVTAFVDKVRAELGPPTILVNAAGIYRSRPIPEQTDADWDEEIAVNLTGPFKMTRAVMPDMIAAGWGRVVNIASTAAHFGAEGYSAYCASKAGLLGLSRVTAIEGAPAGVTCVSVSPTWVETPMMDGAVARGISKASIAAQNPQNRLVQPDEIAAVVALACSDAAPALTNEDIQVNAAALW
ncbi:MAG: SDR family oxidoreductase [Pseudomonadota bacterium]